MAWGLAAREPELEQELTALAQVLMAWELMVPALELELGWAQAALERALTARALMVPGLARGRVAVLVERVVQGATKACLALTHP
ncbi:MAG: hypothetical protein ACK4VV_02400 [Pseudomonas sp.]